LASLYLQDPNSGRARVWIAAHASPLALSRIAELELFNACRLSVFRGWVSDDECRRVLADIRSDLREGVLIRQPFSADEIFKMAEQLSAKHSVQFGNHSLDMLHIAQALHYEFRTFASFDQRQRSLAERCGLQTVPESLGS
jgi:predicted nucleic acid-binding protein